MWKSRPFAAAVLLLFVGACVLPFAFVWRRGNMPLPGWSTAAVVIVFFTAFAGFAVLIAKPSEDPAERTALQAARRFFARPWGRLLAGVIHGALFLVFVAAVPRMITGRLDGSWLIAALAQLPMGVMFVGMALLGGVLIRRGTVPQCAACEYDLTGAPEGGYDVCPECGTGLRGAGKIVTGRKHLHRPLLVAGLLCSAAPFVYFTVMIRTPGLSQSWYLSLVPTGSLMAEVTAAPRGFTMDEWTELATRTLTPEQTVRLARGMIDLRLRKGYIDRLAEGFLEAAALDGRMPLDLRERYFAEMVDVWLAAPEQLGPRGHARVGLGALHRGNLSNPVNTMLVEHVVVECFEVDGTPLPAGDCTGLGNTVRGISLKTMSVFKGPQGDRRIPSPRGPAAVVRTDGAGPVTVRALGWVFVAPAGSDAIALPDGSIALPAGTAWSRRLEASAVLTPRRP